MTSHALFQIWKQNGFTQKQNNVIINEFFANSKELFIEFHIKKSTFLHISNDCELCFDAILSDNTSKNISVTVMHKILFFFNLLFLKFDKLE